MQVKIDPEFRELCPPLREEEYEGLEESIITEGCRVPLDVWNGVIIDGHNRYEICQKHGIEFKTNEIEFDNRTSAKIWIGTNQLARRNLNLYQRGNLILALKPLIAEQAKAKQGTRTDLLANSPKSSNAINTREELAKAAKIGSNTMSRIEKIKKEATEDQKKALVKSEASINQVYTQIKSKERREKRIQTLLNLSKPVELNTLGRFPVIYADPPWRYEHSKTDNRKIENQYPTMSLDDIKALDIDSATTNDCILFLWATSPKLSEAMGVISAWGFTYRTCMVWVKDKIGMGYYVRQRQEVLLIATKGKMVTPEPATRPDSVIEAPREKHSKKPDVVYEIIEKMYPELPKLELFQREPREGWQGWGNEAQNV